VGRARHAGTAAANRSHSSIATSAPDLAKPGYAWSPAMLSTGVELATGVTRQRQPRLHRTARAIAPRFPCRTGILFGVASRVGHHRTIHLQRGWRCRSGLGGLGIHGAVAVGRDVLHRRHAGAALPPLTASHFYYSSAQYCGTVAASALILYFGIPDFSLRSRLSGCRVERLRLDAAPGFLIA
jgi:hypothetical protein